MSIPIKTPHPPNEREVHISLERWSRNGPTRYVMLVRKTGSVNCIHISSTAAKQLSKDLQTDIDVVITEDLPI